MVLKDTADKVEAWRRGYNEERPHSAVGNKVTAALMKLPDAFDPSAGSIRRKLGPDCG